MTTDPTRPTIPHAARCGRRSAPVLRLSWRGAPELWCPDCGRHAPADDTRPTETAGAATATPASKKGNTR